MADPIANLVAIGERYATDETDRERLRATYERRAAGVVHNPIHPVVAERLLRHFGTLESVLTLAAVDYVRGWRGAIWLAVARALESGLPDEERARLRARVDADHESGAAMLAAHGAPVDVGAVWREATDRDHGCEEDRAGVHRVGHADD